MDVEETKNSFKASSKQLFLIKSTQIHQQSVFKWDKKYMIENDLDFFSRTN